MDIDRRLRALDLFGDVSEEQLRTIAELVEERQVGEGTVLAGEGAHGYFFFVIESGTADVLHGGQVIRRLAPGDFFGEIAVLEGRFRRRTASVVASSPMRLFAFFGVNYHALAAAAPQVHERVRAVILDRLAVRR